MSPSKDEPPSNPSASKPAIKGFSLSAKPSSKPGGAKHLSKPSPASSLGKRPRSTFASHHSNSGSDDDDERPAKHEAVTVFGAEGAIRENERRKEGPLVIPKLSNRDWRGEARARIGGRGGGKNLLPAEVQVVRKAAAEGGNGLKQEGVDVVNSGDEEMQWGLSVRKKKDTVDVEAESTKDEGTHANDVGEAVDAEPPPPKTADEEALEALLGNRRERKGPDLVIPAASATLQDTDPVSETDAYRRAIASAPDVSTLEDYERVPVEEFGAALLRGMGWKGPSVDGKTGVKEVKRRQNLLGLGAKELKDAEELGAWVQKSDVKRLNGGGNRRASGGGGERRPKASEYRREKERRDERREERGGSYRRERERDGGRDYRDRDRERERDRDRRR